MSTTAFPSYSNQVTMQHKAYVYAGPSKSQYGNSIGYIDPGDTVYIHWKYGEWYFVEYPISGGWKTGYVLKTEFNDVSGLNTNSIGIMPQSNQGYRYVNTTTNIYYGYRDPLAWAGVVAYRSERVYYTGVKYNGYALITWPAHDLNVDAYGWIYAQKLSVSPVSE